jgi:hypothetical protein
MFIAKQLKQWRKDIQLMDTEGVNRSQAAIRVYAYNWATSPYIAMTDREHRACRRFSRRVIKQLKKFTGWHEQESGRLWI